MSNATNYVSNKSLINISSSFLGDHDQYSDLPAHMTTQDMYHSGQPLDNEPNMGQVPMIPPGTPPNEAWGHGPFSGLPTPPGQGFLGRRSPNLPMGQQPMMPNDTMQGMMVTGNPNMAATHARNLQAEVSEADHYQDYTPTQNHVEVY